MSTILNSLKFNQDQICNAKIIYDRYSIFDHIKKDSSLRVLEIGVMAGDFADKILINLNVDELVLLDPFDNDDAINKNIGEPERFTSTNNWHYIKGKYKDNKNVKVLKGMSYDMFKLLLENSLDNKFDFVHIDSDHECYNTYNEILYSSQMLSDDGIIAIDDFWEGDQEKPFGVREAVLLFLHLNKNWEVKFFTFHTKGMYCIYLGKK